MIEALSGLLIVAIIAVAVLVYLEVFDLSDLVGGVIQLLASAVKLIAGLLFALGAFFVWLVNRSRQQNKP